MRLGIAGLGKMGANSEMWRQGFGGHTLGKEHTS
jgi:hypothetical protein